MMAINKGRQDSGAVPDRSTIRKLWQYILIHGLVKDSFIGEEERNFLPLKQTKSIRHTVPRKRIRIKFYHILHGAEKNAEKAECFSFFMMGLNIGSIVTE